MSYCVGHNFIFAFLALTQELHAFRKARSKYHHDAFKRRRMVIVFRRQRNKRIRQKEYACNAKPCCKAIAVVGHQRRGLWIATDFVLEGKTCKTVEFSLM